MAGQGISTVLSILLVLFVFQSPVDANSNWTVIQELPCNSTSSPNCIQSKSDSNETSLTTATAPRMMPSELGPSKHGRLTTTSAVGMFEKNKSNDSDGHLENSTNLAETNISESESAYSTTALPVSAPRATSASAVLDVDRHLPTEDASVDNYLNLIQSDGRANDVNEDNCDGFACEKDQFCSQQWKRCRQCHDIKRRCQEMDDILANVPACEKYCLRLKMEAVNRTCAVEKSEYRQKIEFLQRSLNESDFILNETRLIAEMDRSSCLAEKEQTSQTIVKQDTLVDQLNRKLNQTRKMVADCKDEGQNLKGENARLWNEVLALRAAVGVLVALALTGAIAVVKFRKNVAPNAPPEDPVAYNMLNHARQPTKEADAEKHADKHKLLPTGAETPVMSRHNAAGPI